MKRLEVKSRIASWVLLSVFVPMMALVSFHLHHVETDVENICVQCEHHQPHPGHFTSQTVSHDDCVICQFTSLTYVQPDAVVLFAINTLSTADEAWRPRFVAAIPVGHQSSRAPPVTF